MAAARDALAVDAAATELVGHLLREHADRRCDDVRAGGGARARERLHERLSEPPSLDELAAAVGVGKFRLLRSFGRGGHAAVRYLVHLLVSRARELLAAGASAAAVAAEVGFLRSEPAAPALPGIVGVGPGAYARQR